MNSSFDFIVVGAGIAGLRAAIELNQYGSVLCLAKRELTESNTQYAQGGIAVALGPDDSPEIHLHDTLAAGAGLVDENAARTLVTEGPTRVLELLDWGVRFDRDAHGQLAFTREGAHSRNRVLHADGDSTGREIGRTLYQHARTLRNIHFGEFGFARDLLLQDGRVVGVEILQRGRTQRSGNGARSAAGNRRRGNDLRQYDQSRCGHRRRCGDGLARRSGTERHGVLAVSSHRSLHHGRATVPAL